MSKKPHILQKNINFQRGWIHFYRYCTFHHWFTDVSSSPYSSLRPNNHAHTQRDIHIVWSVIFYAALLWYNSGLDTITISKSNGASTAFASFRRLSTLSLLLACSVQHHKTPRWSNPYSEVITRCYGVRPQHRICFILTCCGLRTLVWQRTRLTGVVTDHRRQTARLSLAS